MHLAEQGHPDLIALKSTYRARTVPVASARLPSHFLQGLSSLSSNAKKKGSPRGHTQALEKGAARSVG